MKKVLKWGSIAVVLLVVIGVAVVYFRLGAIVEYAVESQGSQQMSLKTELDGASVGLFGGEVELDELKIANPPGFEAPHLFTLGGVDVKVPISELRSNPKRVSSITLDKPKLVIERGADGRFNFKAAIDQMPKSPTPTGPAPTEPSPAPTEPAPPAPAGAARYLLVDDQLHLVPRRRRRGTR
jgi:AsmA protein